MRVVLAVTNIQNDRCEDELGGKGKMRLATYLCCPKTDLEEVVELIRAEIPGVTSCFLPGDEASGGT